MSLLRESALVSEPELLEALRERLAGTEGLDLSTQHLPIIDGQVRGRMKARGLGYLDDYLRFLDDVPEECGLLREALLIGSTRFFRDEEVFEALSGGALDALGSKHGGPLKVWVPGCSTGEETYSIAMVLRERLDARGDTRALRVFATDVRESAILTGRRGVYSERACNAIAPERRARFFERAGGGFRATRSLRDQIVWGVQDVRRDPPFPAMDLVSCRNLLVYFERESQARILAKFHFSLRLEGLLLLGSAESTRTAPSLFQPVSLPIRLYARSPARAYAGPRWAS